MNFSLSGLGFWSRDSFKLLVRNVNSVLGKRVLSGVFWSTAGTVVSRGSGLIASIPLAHMLGRNGFGEYGIILSTMMMFSTFAGWGLGVVNSKYLAEFKDTDPAKAGRILMLTRLFSVFCGTISCVAMILGAPWLSTRILLTPHLENFIALGSAAVFLATLNQAQTGTLGGFEAFRVVTFRNAIIGILRILMLTTGTWLWGLYGTVWGMIVTETIAWFVNYVTIRNECNKYEILLVFRGCFKELEILWKFSLPSVIVGILVVIIHWVGNAILVRSPSGLSEMGVYSVATQWKMVILFLPIASGTAIFPILSNLLGKGDGHKYQKLLRSDLAITSIVAAALAIIIAVLSPTILALYGKEFLEGKAVLRIAAFSAVFFALHMNMNRVLASRARMWSSFTFKLCLALLYLSLAKIFVDSGMGAKGLATAELFSHFTIAIAQFVYLKRKGDLF